MDWTEHEDAVLFQHIEEHGAKKWGLVAQALQGSKTANQCRLRWHAINPERCNEPFTEEANEHILRFVDDCIAANDGVRPKKMKYVALMVSTDRCTLASSGGQTCVRSCANSPARAGARSTSAGSMIG